MSFSWGDEEVNADSLSVSPLLDNGDGEIEESDKSSTLAERRCSVHLFQLTSHNVWVIRDQSTSAGGDSETGTWTKKKQGRVDSRFRRGIDVMNDLARLCRL